MSHLCSRPRFPQETKPGRLVTEISLADDFERHGTLQIDVERLVSNPHRTATQLDRFPSSPVTSSYCSNRCSACSGVGLSVSPEEDLADSTPPAKPSRSRHIGQNAIASESSLPQLRQVRWGSVFMDLTVLRIRLKLRKEYGFPRRSPPDLTHWDQPARATLRGAKRTC